MKITARTVAFLLAASTLLPAAAVLAGPEDGVPLIPRTVLFGNPDRRASMISPDGKYLSWLAPVNNVMNVHVAPVGDPAAATVVTNDTKRGIRAYSWSYDGKHLLYTQDVGGDENWKIYAVDVTAAKPAAKDLTPFDEIKGEDGKAIEMGGKKLRPAAQINEVSHARPGEIVIGLNNRDPQHHDLYICDLATGKLTLLLKNDEYAAVQVDDQYRVRLATTLNKSGGADIVKNKAYADGKVEWEPFASVPMEDAAGSQVVGFDATGDLMYMTDTRGRNTAALKSINTKTGETKVVAEDAKSDAGGVMADPKTGIVQAVSFTYDRTKWKVLDDSIKGDLEYLSTLTDGEVGVSSRTQDDTKWMVGCMVDNGPAKAYLYDRATKKATFLWTNAKALDNQPLVKMHSLTIKSRDGLDMVSYLTLPPGTDLMSSGIPNKPVPMVLLVHGGPWARDGWGYNPIAQWLSNRGYACLMVNFRASTGFGKNFMNAGNREWGGKMHDDLIDAVNYAVEKKIALKDKVAIMGGSYGGYATLAGLTFTPDVFACGVDIVGPSNIVTLLNSIPPYWAPMIELMTKQVGDHRTEEGRAFLASKSPLTYAEKISKPLLIGQGANDPRVNQAEADQIVSAMLKKGLPVTYVLYPDEGHGFQRPANRLSFNAVTEQFLKQHLGGRAEPIGGDFKGSSITVPTGVEMVPGVKDALPRTMLEQDEELLKDIQKFLHPDRKPGDGLIAKAG